ncbi:hypothetical protein BSL78_04999 [Apostichopus japonicus]|uniref:purine-nucleoside phosphorylase n=1 Tax=Stichopus japonicus TaxID=307972 RepID=A0A2G8LD00_STIJA|nr:hypothetical protein BSL78_04999 [Apostichopus japonicus]
MSKEDTPYSYEQLEKFATIIKEKTGSFHPSIGIIAGSGQGVLVEAVQNAITIPYTDIEGFPQSTVAGHSGEFVVGKIGDKDVLVMSGRLHLYEGYPAWKLVAPIRVMSLLGIKTLIVCNAAGGINRDFKVGDFMLMKDHIGFPILAGQNPLRGPNDERWVLGWKHPWPAFAHGTGLLDWLCMSTVPEAIAARHCGMEVLGMSMVTNACIMENDIEQKTDHQEVLETGKRQGESMCKLISKIVEKMDHKEQNGA